MTDNMFDKFVSDKLRDHQSPVPQGLWEKIERKKEKEPCGGFWWFRGIGFWAALFVLFAGVGTGYYLMNAVETSSKQVNETAALNDNGSSATNDLTGGNNGGNEVSAGNGGDQQLQNDNAITKNNTFPKDSEISETKTNKSGNAIDQNTTTAKTISKKSKPGDQSKVDYSVVDEPTSSATNSKLNFRKKATQTRVENRTDGNVVGTATNIPASAITNDQLHMLSKGTLALMGKKNTLGNMNLDASKLRIWGIDCPTAGRPKRNDFYLELYASPDFAMKSVSSSNAAILQKKDSVESTQLGYTAGLRFAKAISDNILVKAGFQYSQINERLDVRTENERRITTVITIRTVTTPSGTDTMIRDTTTLEQIGYSLKRTYNRYRSFDIPLLVSYEFGNEKLKFGVNGGVILNLRSWYSGETINDSLAIVSLNSKTAPAYKHNIGLGLYAGFSIIKPVNNKFDLFLEPYFRYNLGNMTSGATYTQKFNAAGVSFGIRYKLNGQRR